MAFKTGKEVLEMAQKEGQYWSDYDKELAQRDPDAGLSIYTAKKNYLSAKTDADRKHWNQQAEGIRKRNGGYTAGGDGSGFMKNNQYFTYHDPFSQSNDRFTYHDPYADKMNAALDKLLGYENFKNPYQDKIDSTLDKITGRDPFSYDAEKDPMFQQYRKTYLREGQRANEDTMGNYAAMTGGMPSTAAVNAASQAQDYYNAKMSDKIPELYTLAYQMYADEGDNLLNQLSAIRGLGQDALSAWGANMGLAQSQLDAVGQMSDRDYNRAFGKWNADQQMSDRDYNRALDKWRADHQVDREAVADSQWQQQHNLNAQTRAQELMNQVLQTGQIPTHDTIVAAGFNDTDAAKIAKWMKEQVDMERAMQKLQLQGAQLRASGGGSSSGRSSGGRRSNGGKSAGFDGDIFAQLAAGGAENYGDAYTRLRAQGIKESDAKIIAKSFSEDYYPEWQDKKKVQAAANVANQIVPDMMLNTALSTLNRYGKRAVKKNKK